MAVSVKMSSKNQIVVPKEAREALQLVPGDRLVVVVRDSTIEMEKQPPDLEDRLEGALGSVRRAGDLWRELGMIEPGTAGSGR